MLAAFILACAMVAGASEASGDHYYCCVEDEKTQCCGNKSSLFLANDWDFGAAVTVAAAASSLMTSEMTL
jgi:hypothetical protein